MLEREGMCEELNEAGGDVLFFTEAGGAVMKPLLRTHAFEERSRRAFVYIAYIYNICWVRFDVMTTRATALNL
jgi:hypothetical protein